MSVYYYTLAVFCIK